jgi:hypothetical protein
MQARQSKHRSTDRSTYRSTEAASNYDILSSYAWEHCTVRWRVRWSYVCLMNKSITEFYPGT